MLFQLVTVYITTQIIFMNWPSLQLSTYRCTCIFFSEISWKFIKKIQTQKYMYCQRETFRGLVRMIFGMVHVHVHHRLLELASKFFSLYPVDCYMHTIH